MRQDKDGKTDIFNLESDLFPAFRKAVSAARELGLEDRPEQAEHADREAAYSRRAGSPDGMPSDKYGGVPAGRDIYSGSLPEEEAPEARPAAGRVTGENKPAADQQEEKIPALFGNVCLDKYKKREESVDESEHFPTLLEFLSQPPEETPLPVPSLFDGIGKQYFASEEVLRLAAEAEAEEAAQAAQGLPEEEPETPEAVEEEPAPDAEELFGMISSIYNQQRVDWDRHLYENELYGRRRSDPYNTAFNSRQPAVNYENVDEMPFEQIYKLTPVESNADAGGDGAKRRVKKSGARRHFKINK